MPDEKKSSLLLEIAKLLTAALVPLAIFLVGNQYTSQKDSSDREQRNLDRISGLIKNLASENSSERVMAINYITFLAQKQEAPADLVPLLISSVEKKPESPEGRAAATALKTIETNKSLSPLVQQTLSSLPARVFLHIRDEAQRAKAKDIQDQLVANGWPVPGIERVSAGPEKTIVKYFRPEDQPEAQQIADALHNLKIDATTSNSSAFLKSANLTVPPRHFEIWFSPTVLK